MQILSNNDGNGLDGRAMMVLSTISEPGETLRTMVLRLDKILENDCSCLLFSG